MKKALCPSKRVGCGVISTTILSGFLAVLGLIGICGITAAPVYAAPSELVIYAYDSFASPKGAGSQIIPLFEKQCACKVRLLASGDAAQLLTRLQLDEKRGKSDAHLVLGLDQQLFAQAKPYLEAMPKWTPQGYSDLIVETKVGEGFVPFDYGVFALMGDQTELTRLKLSPPQKLADLLKPEYRRNIILEDPRTSSPGLAFLLFTNEVLGAGFQSFWASFKSQWLTLTPGWDGAYGLFLRKEAPLVWSYSTSEAYHQEHGDSKGEQRRYRAFLFEEGQPIQVEGAAMIKRSLWVGSSAANDALEKLAKAFLEFLLTPQSQTRIAHANWMLPVRQGVGLPGSYKGLPVPRRQFRIEKSAAETARILSLWQKEVERR
ncbi:thiamine ABC transporter substrate-binding protein [Bdellovibrionota bacterium FG-2]